jgi:hypothetical protein
VITRMANRPVNVLAILDEPSADEVARFSDERFGFRGFDLVEDATGISALINCGGFDKAFLRSDLSDRGLLVDHAKARDVQTRLRIEYPESDHAQCRLWALWQMT